MPMNLKTSGSYICLLGINAGTSISAILNQRSLVETEPKFLGRNSVNWKVFPGIMRLGCVEGRRDISEP